jgi:MFS family permease
MASSIVVEHFNAIDRLPWLSNGFALGAVATTLVWGRIYSQFDAKWLYIFNVLLFEVGSTLCGAAPNMPCLIIGRVLAGIGGMGMYIGVMTLIAYTTTMQERSIYVGLTGLTWGAGTVLGPVIGGESICPCSMSCHSVQMSVFPKGIEVTR